MGVVNNVGFDKMPKQGYLLGKQVNISFNYDTANVIEGTCVRDDMEEPYETLFQIGQSDGADRIVRAVECQYKLKE